MIDFSHLKDFELIALLKQDNENCFHYLFDYYYLPVKSNIEYFIHDKVIAEDILQEVFISFWLQRHQLQNTSKIEGWLFTVSHNKSISYVRDRIKNISSPNSLLLNEDIVPSSHAYETSAILDEEIRFAKKIEHLRNGIKTLPPQTKKAFLLYKIHGYSYEDISSQLGITVESAKQYVKNGMKYLKRYTGLHYRDIFIMSYIIVKSIVLAKNS